MHPAQQAGSVIVKKTSQRDQRFFVIVLQAVPVGDDNGIPLAPVVNLLEGSSLLWLCSDQFDEGLCESLEVCAQRILMVYRTNMVLHSLQQLFGRRRHGAFIRLKSRRGPHRRHRSVVLAHRAWR